MSTRRPAPPPGLSRRGPGRRLWFATIRDYELTPPERVLLGEICRVLDRIGALVAELDGQPTIVRGSTGQPKINPILAEVRAHQGLLGRLIDSLHIDTDEAALAGLLTSWDRADA
jgi:hypothetical protein